MSETWTGTWCTQCGPDVAVDEDGACAVCGTDATGEGAETALRMREGLRGAESALAGERARAETAERDLLRPIRETTDARARAEMAEDRARISEEQLAGVQRGELVVCAAGEMDALRARAETAERERDAACERWRGADLRLTIAEGRATEAERACDTLRANAAEDRRRIADLEAEVAEDARVLDVLETAIAERDEARADAIRLNERIDAALRAEDVASRERDALATRLGRCCALATLVGDERPVPEPETKPEIDIVRLVRERDEARAALAEGVPIVTDLKDTNTRLRARIGGLERAIAGTYETLNEAGDLCNAEADRSDALRERLAGLEVALETIRDGAQECAFGPGTAADDCAASGVWCPWHLAVAALRDPAAALAEHDRATAKAARMAERTATLADLAAGEVTWLAGWLDEHDAATRADERAAVVAALLARGFCDLLDEEAWRQSAESIAAAACDVLRATVAMEAGAACQRGREAALREAADKCAFFATLLGDCAAGKQATACGKAILALAPASPPPAPDAWCACGERLKADGTCPLEPRRADDCAPKETP